MEVGVGKGRHLWPSSPDVDGCRLQSAPSARSVLVVQGYDLSSVGWFCCYGKSAKKGCISCTAQILWVFNIQFLLRTLRIIPLILNCLNVETYGLVCCSLGNNCLYPGCQIQTSPCCRNVRRLGRTFGKSCDQKANLMYREMLIKLVPDISNR